MKLQKYLILFISLFLLVSCFQRRIITPTTSTAAFDDLGVLYQRTDPDGKDYFQVFGKGNSVAVCRTNAKLQLLKTLVYEGINRGVNYPPILNENKSINDFKEVEGSFTNKWIDNDNMFQIQRTNYDETLSQSDNDRTQYSIKLIVGINRTKLKAEVLKIIGIK